MAKLTITTSKELSSKKKSEIEARLQKKYGDFEAIYRIDKSIVGGIIIFDGQIAYDGSLKTQLTKFKDKMIEKLK
ncbi:MAG TPA: F0F1 ATP synthase subunit delta [Clostridia bacterium]|jgi:F0F1-type ATP synthase delta subunit|nr:F0F1 ATP synthase subunit delta [Clostridia bacterium]